MSLTQCPGALELWVYGRTVISVRGLTHRVKVQGARFETFLDSEDLSRRIIRAPK